MGAALVAHPHRRQRADMTKPYHKNPRQITGKQYEQLKDWLLELGDLSGIVHDLNSDEIIGGNQRSAVFDLDDCTIEITEQLDAPDKQGTVAHGFVVWRGHRYAYRQVRWTERQCEKANIVANRAGGAWDFDVLANEFDIDDLFSWGFEPIDFGLDEPEEEVDPQDAAPQVDRAEELREEWGVELGQMWRLPARDGSGEHRIVCGDCTDADVVQRVMDGDVADATLTDPPYGVNIEYDGFVDTPENVKSLISGFFSTAFMPMAVTPGVPAMWDYPRPSWVGSWVHPAATSSGPWGFISSNPILYYGSDPYLKDGLGRRDCSFVLVADRGGESSHPVTKPLNVWEWIAKRIAPTEKSVIYDPFSGSGTTIIACENLNRYCRAIEISPSYTAVTLQRYVDAFGVQPELIIADQPADAEPQPVLA